MTETKQWNKGLTKDGRLSIWEDYGQGYGPVICNLSINSNEEEQNLIAAAPDLLAASEYFCANFAGTDWNIVEMSERALKAIAKAKGEV